MQPGEAARAGKCGALHRTLTNQRWRSIVTAQGPPERRQALGDLWNRAWAGIFGPRLGQSLAIVRWRGCPQQPPTMFRKPTGQTLHDSPVSSGDSSYSPNSFGRPGVWVRGDMRGGLVAAPPGGAQLPVHQGGSLRPTEIGLAWQYRVPERFGGLPDRVRRRRR